jgi:hypothetical protein
MQSTEEEVQTYTSIARNAVGGQAFQSDATAYPSQAEITLNRYSTERIKRTVFPILMQQSWALLLDRNPPALGARIPIPGCITR